MTALEKPEPRKIILLFSWMPFYFKKGEKYIFFPLYKTRMGLFLLVIVQELDGVGPVDNKPSPN